jgi:hypothetical protein
MDEEIFKNYYGNNYEKVKAATPIEIRKMKENLKKVSQRNHVQI